MTQDLETTATKMIKQITDRSELVEHATKAVQKTGSLEIALTEVGMCVGAIVGSIVTERTGTSNYFPITMACALAGAGVGRSAAGIYRILSDYK